MHASSSVQRDTQAYELCRSSDPVFSCCERPQKAWVQQSAPKRQRGLTKSKEKPHCCFTSLFQAETTAWGCCKAFNSQWCFTFVLRESGGGGSKTWTLMLNRHPFGGSSKGSDDETCSTPRLACPSTTGKPKWHRHYGVVSSADISKWSKWARQSPREQKRSELTLAEC